jgi:hypothetical protein
MMNKKALTQNEIIVAVITLMVVALGAIMFISAITPEVKDKIKWVEEKAGLMTPVGTELAQIQEYVKVLLADDTISLIDDSVKIHHKEWNWLGMGSEKAYNDSSGQEKIDRYYKMGKSLAELYQNKQETSDADWTELDKMKLKLELAYDYAYNYYIFYYKLLQPKNEFEAGTNCILLKALKPKIESLSLRIPPDFTDLTEKVNALKTALGNINQATPENMEYCCSVGSSICEDKMKYLCRWGREVNKLNLVSDTKCVRDICDTEPYESSCNINPKCYVNWYTANWKDSVGGSFDGCKDCKDFSCLDKNYKTCLAIVKKCGKCKATYDSAGIFNVCAT